MRGLRREHHYTEDRQPEDQERDQVDKRGISGKYLGRDVKTRWSSNSSLGRLPLSKDPPALQPFDRM